MAIQVADLSTYYSAMTTTDVNEIAVWPMICNRMWEAELQGQDKVVIQDPAYNTEPASRDRGDAFTNTKAEVSSDQIVLTVNHRSEQRNVLDYEDSEETPINWLNRIRASQAIDMASGGPNSVNSTVYADMTRSAGFAAAQKQTLGTDAADFISRSGSYSGTGRGYGLILDAITRWDNYRKRGNFDGPTIGGGVGESCIVMAPELFSGFRQWLVEQKYQWDELTRQALVNGGVLTGEDYEGMIFNTKFFTSNRYNVPTGNGDWKMHAFTTAAFTFAMKSPLVQILSPTTNQSGPEWDMKQIGRWAVKEINPAFKFEFTIKAD